MNRDEALYSAICPEQKHQSIYRPLRLSSGEATDPRLKRLMKHAVLEGSHTCADPYSYHAICCKSSNIPSRSYPLVA